MSLSTKTIKLPSGAQLTVTIDANLFDLAEADRELVFGIIDQARRFVEDVEAQAQAHAEPSEPPSWCAICRTAEHCHGPGGSRYPSDHDFVAAVDARAT